MKKKNHFIAYMIAIMIMLFSLPVKAQKVGYAQWDSTNNTLTFRGGDSVPKGNNYLSIDFDGFGTPEWNNKTNIQKNCATVVFDDSFKDVRPTSCYLWFSSFSALETIVGIENLNTKDVMNMWNMFYGCSKLETLDLSSFNTSNVTNMNYMFFNCSSLKTIYVSDNFTTNKVAYGEHMFDGCPQLVGATPYDSEKDDKSMANYKKGYFKTYYKLGDEEKVELCGDPLQTTNRLALSDDKNFVAHAPFKASSVSYTREPSSSQSKWYTLCLPFAYTPTNFNFNAYQLKSATSSSVEIEEITGEIAAGTPIIFKFNGDDKNINITATDANIENDPGMASTTEGNGCQLYGTYQKKTFSLQDNNTFIIYKDNLMNPAKMLKKNSATTIGLKPFHAYMTMTSQAGASASAKSFSIGSGDEETTAIDLLNSVATDDAEYYDINGRRIDAPVKGVNIVRRGNKTMKLIIK